MTGPEVLTTKLHPAATAPDWVWRPRLVDALEACWHTPLALVSAPAGYGKSVLVTQWAAAHQGRVAWVELDGRDSNPEDVRLLHRRRRPRARPGRARAHRGAARRVAGGVRGGHRTVPGE